MLFKVVLALILMFLSISSGSLLGAAFYEKKYETLLPATQILIMIVLFVGGVFGVLLPAFFLCLSSILIIYSIVLISAYTNKDVFYKIKHNFFNRSFWIFLAFFTLISFANYGKLAHVFDEFSLWATCVRAMSIKDVLYTDPSIYITSKDYPPGMGLIQYFYEKIQWYIVGEDKYMDCYTYIAYQAMMGSLLLPSIKHINFKGWHYYIAIICIFCSPIIFFHQAYDVILVDQIAGVLMGYISVELAEREKRTFDIVTIMLALSFLIMLKEIYVFFSLIISIYIFFDLLRENKNYKKKNVNKVYWLFLMAFPYIFWLLWKIHIKQKELTAVSERAINKIDLKKIIEIIGGVADKSDYKYDVFYEYINKYFTSGIIIGNTNIKISFFVFLIILFALISLIISSSSDDQEKNNYFRYFFMLFILHLVYLLLLGATYLFVMSKGEALRLSSYERYIGTLFLAMFYYVEYIYLKFLSQGNDVKESRGQQRVGVYKISPVVFVFCIILMLPCERLVSFIDRSNVYESQKNLEYKSLSEVIDSNVNENDKIYYLDLDVDNRTMLPYYKIRYELLSEDIEFSWISENDFLNKETRDRILANHDFIILINNTDSIRKAGFVDQYNYEASEVMELYKVENHRLLRIA